MLLNDISLILDDKQEEKIKKMKSNKFTKKQKPLKNSTRSRRLKNIKMKYKLLLVLWVVGLIPMILVAGIATVIGVRNLEAQTKSKLSSFAENKHQMVVEWFQNQNTYIKTMASSEEIISGLRVYSTGGPEWIQKSQSLERTLNIMKIKNNYADVFVADVNGEIICSTIPENKGKKLTSDDLIVILSGGAGFDNMKYLDSEGCMAVLMGATVKQISGDMSPLGSFGIYLSIDQINTMLSNGLDNIGKTANAYLIDSQCKLLSLPRFEKGYEINQTVLNNGVAKLGKAVTGMQVAFKETMSYYNRTSGKNVLASLSALGLRGKPIGVIIEVDQNEAYKPTLIMLQMVGIVILISIILQLFIGSIFAKSIAQPIRTMVSDIKLIAGGDLTVRVAEEGKDEIGEMAIALNQMLGNLAQMVHQVIDSGRLVRNSSQQISTVSQDLSERTQEQAATLEEIAATIEEVSSSVSQAAANSERADKISKLTLEAIEQGEDSIRETRGAMDQLQQSSRQIGEIIQAVNDLAFQTNLLALNAAIEAARAGEQGRGFAVVATEVRNLARRSAESAKEIETLIKESIAKVENGNDQVQQSSEMLKQIIDNTKQTADVIAELAMAMREQALSAQQVQVSIEQLNQVTQQNAAVVEEMSASSESLNSEAGNLNNMVNQFKLKDEPETSTPVISTEPPINEKGPTVTTNEFRGDDWAKF